MSIDTEFSAVVFSKDLPQSSFRLESPVQLSPSRFKNAPLTLFDDQDDDSGREMMDEQNESGRSTQVP